MFSEKWKIVQVRERIASTDSAQSDLQSMQLSPGFYSDNDDVGDDNNNNNDAIANEHSRSTQTYYSSKKYVMVMTTQRNVNDTLNSALPYTLHSHR